MHAGLFERAPIPRRAGAQAPARHGDTGEILEVDGVLAEVLAARLVASCPPALRESRSEARDDARRAIASTGRASGAAIVSAAPREFACFGRA